MEQDMVLSFLLVYSLISINNTQTTSMPVSIISTNIEFFQFVYIQFNSIQFNSKMNLRDALVDCVKNVQY